jgi:hypothetical protein
MGDVMLNLEKSLATAVTERNSEQAWAALKEFAQLGGTQDEATKVLSVLRDHASTEEEEDWILDIMDVVWGWCNPQSRIW